MGCFNTCDFTKFRSFLEICKTDVRKMNFWWKLWTKTLQLSSAFRFVTDFLGYVIQNNLSATHISWSSISIVIILCEKN